jgi:GGDEF domain-containing protein
LIGFANVVRSLLGPHDIAGHFGGTTLMLLLERGNARDVEAWSENLVERMASHSFQVDGHALHATCTAGLSMIPTAKPDLDASRDGSAGDAAPRP